MAPSRASICSNCLRILRRQHNITASRSFASSTARDRESTTTYDASDTSNLPRWTQTPPAMKMPVRTRPRPNQPVFAVNTDPKKLDEVYDRFLGTKYQGQDGPISGRDILDEETKWLAVTHKSFDHARRGNNDRLAYLGKRIVDLQTSLALLNAPGVRRTAGVQVHPTLIGLESLTPFARATVLERTRIAKLAQSYGLDGVMRWKPRNSERMQESGIDTVLAHTLYSIIGALSLQKGGEFTGKVVRQRILAPLGLR